MENLGKVYLVGAGPGAADLITVRGSRLLAQAQIVFYDALVSEEMLEFCPQAVKILVGKRCGKLSTAQRFIEKRMIDAAHKYEHIVRLKGGDPMMFGRADEELRALEAAGIEVEVVPGVTAALAAAASLQQSLTLRGVSRSVAFVTKARGFDEKPSGENNNAPIDLPQADTLVYYMGRKDAIEIAQQLIASGRDSKTPVVIIEAISTPVERSVTVDLAQMVQGKVNDWFAEDVPALLLVGQAMEKRAISQVDLKQLGFGVSEDGLQDLEIFTNGRRSA
jgi:uroporphyrin-III C-methyltransferase